MKTYSNKLKHCLLPLLLCAMATPALAAADDPSDPDMTRRMMLLALQLGVIIFAAKLGGMLFKKLKLPGVLGELCSGMLIGPYALGSISFYGFSNGLFPIVGDFAISPELYGIASVAAIILLFVTGIETDLRMLMRFSVVGSIVGIGGVIASFVLGDLTVMLFSQKLFGETLGFFHPACLFLGVVSTATSVGITARVLSEKRKLDSPEGVTILAGAVVDDVLGIVLLAVILGVVSAAKRTGSIDWGHIGVIAAKAVGIWLGATAVAILASRRISFLLKLFGDRSSIAIMALGLALILAGLFEEAGLAMIIGAYIAGLSISRMDISHVVREKLAPVYALLVPIFFCVMGMLVDFGALTSKTVLLFGLVYSLVAIVAKLVGCGAPCLFANFNMRGALRIGFGMVPRGEVALVVAGIGLAAGVFKPQVFGIAIMMTLLTTLLAPPILSMLFSSDARGTRTPVEWQEGAVLDFEFASPEIAEFLAAKLRTVFESEGFFVHMIDHDRQIYQLRKDRITIGLSRKESTISFTCDESEAAFVNTALYEVLGQLEQTIRGLQKPVDKAAIVRRVQEATWANGNRFDLSGYLKLDLLEPRLNASDKNGVIDELLAMLQRSGLLKDVEAARRAVLEREESMSTGMERGIAIPHAKTDAVEKLVCAIGMKPEGIDFNAFDDNPSTIFVLTLSPNKVGTPHVQFMSAVSQILITDARERLLACQTPAEMYEALTGA